MVTFVCPMCDAKLDNEVRYKEHVHGISHGKGQTFTPPTCPVGKEAHFGLKMQAKEMTQALEQLPLAPSDLLSIVDTLRGMKPPVGDLSSLSFQRFSSYLKRLFFSPTQQPSSCRRTTR
jgi:hypothetical protein